MPAAAECAVSFIDRLLLGYVLLIHLLNFGLLVFANLIFFHHFSSNAANPSAIIRKYHIDMCRQCFRERALDIGFVKVRTFKVPYAKNSYHSFQPYFCFTILVQLKEHLL